MQIIEIFNQKNRIEFELVQKVLRLIYFFKPQTIIFKNTFYSHNTLILFYYTL